jgi:hypothetical protein
VILDLSAELFHATLDGRRRARPFDDRRIRFSDITGPDRNAQPTDAGSRELFLEGVKTSNDDVSVRACWRVTTGNGIVWCSASRRGAAAAVNPATSEEGRFSRGGCAVQRSWPDSGLGLRVVCRRGLRGIEGFAVRVRFDPDRARNARCWRLFTGAGASCSARWTNRSSIASALVKRATVVSFIGLSLLARGTQCCSIGHRKGPSTGV